jgi:putative phage-type endonuclease
MLTKEQLAERKNYIGASECAAVLGVSRWKSPLMVWAEKTGQIESADLSDVLAVEIGNEIEDLVAKLFERRTGTKVHRVNETIYHPSIRFIATNLDRRVVSENVPLECKSAGAWAAREWEDEEIPGEYIIQVMHQLAVTGKPYGYIACLIGGNQKFIWKRIDRDPELCAEILRKLSEFWVKFVEPKVMPHVTKLDAPTLYSLFPAQAPDSVITLGEDANQILDNIFAMEADLKGLEGMIEKGKNEIKALLGTNEMGMTDRFKVTWKEQITRRLDAGKLKDEKPDIYDAFANESKVRVFRKTALKAQKVEA